MYKFFKENMKYSIKATSIIEAIIVLLIVVTGITGVYSLLSSSQKLALSTWNRIEAIQIARDWLESFTNVRDTNWILFSADYDNCWNALNYQSVCIGVNTIASDITTGSYRIFKNWNNQFDLSWTWSSGSNFSNPIYRNDFQVNKDSQLFYTQSWGTVFIPLYTREIQVSYPDGNSNTDKIDITALVQWADSSSSLPQKVELSTTLTNWKAKR
jgi:Tfp pilus assembly protein PilV